MGVPENKPSGFIYFAVLATSLTSFATGVCYVWTSPFIPKFQSPDQEVNPIGRPVTISESAWIVAAMSLGLIIGSILTVFILKFCTKKTVLLLGVGPLVLAHVICIFANQVLVFIFARMLMGIGIGTIWTVLGNYIAEIAEPRNRGLLGSFPGITSNIGNLSVYVMGPYLKIWQFSIVQLVPILLFYIAFGYFVPDSPYDLLLKNRNRHAENSLKRLRRTNNIEKELIFVQETVARGNDNKMNIKDMFHDRSFRKGLMISVTLMICQQLSGFIAVVSYAETIFSLAGDFIPSSVSPMILGLVAIATIVVSSGLVDRMGRKMLLSSACILESISLFALGLYFFRQNNGQDVSAISWVPIASLAIFMVSFNLAVSTVPWIITGEIFSPQVKAFATTITSFSNFMVNFCVILGFPYMVELLGMGWAFWFFAFCMVLASAFCIFILPETKGKNFIEIQDILKK
ncbi:facilitated trehalose transporter Tret1 [Dendroctonus ponderosae]|uniref:facilitated trehalose transporter Tret1 n=1 Tax=Dendroctonus ponderosae TaxID=77166 RepID=UPI002035CEA7|nr:facilitated trehalose transporter Tret1 [Dendroctonus ponderosae]